MYAVSDNEVCGESHGQKLQCECPVLPSISSHEHLDNRGLYHPRHTKKDLNLDFPQCHCKHCHHCYWNRKYWEKKLSDSHPAWKKLCPSNTDWCPRTGVFHYMSIGYHEQFTCSQSWELFPWNQSGAEFASESISL